MRESSSSAFVAQILGISPTKPLVSEMKHQRNSLITSPRYLCAVRLTDHT